MRFRPKVVPMSYQVLARKWRPKQFDELVGQEHVVKALSHALDSGRVHHAYLFTGTRGVGKTTIARIFAKSLNCEKGMSAHPCGECAICKAVDAGRFVDLIEIDAASNTGVDDVREVIENAQYAPAQGRYKVYLVDEVHMLSKSAFNALLKTLEEPPEHVKFLLATTDPQKLPVTVLSRCLKFGLKRLLPEQIAGQMRMILGQENVGFDEGAIEALGGGADVSLRDVL
jgi:DNA polymerase-3 subunit gamma/tau